MFTTAVKNAMLDAIVVDEISAHSGFPALTGSNEISGGVYARAAVTFAAASGGTRLLSSAAGIPVPAGSTVRWLGLWAAGVFKGYAANAGVPREFIADAATDVVTCQGHGYVDTNKIAFYGDTAPAGLTEGTVYYVRDSTADSFKVAATSGGAAINLTSAGGSACVVSAIVEEVYGSDDTHTVNSWTLGLPN